MESFTIEIAGLVTRIQPLFSSTKEYCRSYLTDKDPEHFIDVLPGDLLHAQKLTELEAMQEGIRIRKYSNPYLERATIQRKIAEELLNSNTLLFHGSTVGVDGAAYLFTAPCGTGKSTHTRYWCEVFGKRAVMINDDKPFLRIIGSEVVAYGSPWSGKHGLDTNICLPLKGICFLRRGTENQIARVNPDLMRSDLCHQSFMPEDPHAQHKVYELVEILSQIVPLWEMECTKDPAAALVSYKAMSQNKVSDMP